MKQRRFGFPLLMLLGCLVGAGIAVAVAFALATDSFRYTALFQMTAALAGAGTYLGHVVGASRNKDAGIAAFGPLPQGVMITGAVIWFLGTVAVVGTVLGVMTSIHGPPPH